MEIKDIISIAISFIAIVVTIALFYFQEPENIPPVAIILSVTIISFSLVGFIIIYILSRWNDLSRRVENNKKEILEIKKSLKLHELYNDMEKRLSILEKLLESKNKKGQRGIDPRILYWIILLILLYLLLRSIGFV